MARDLARGENYYYGWDSERICYSSYSSLMHPMDKNHPRTCFACKKDLKWTEYLSSNVCATMVAHVKFPIWHIRNIFRKYKRFKTLWLNNNIQFFCCVCYSNFIEKNKIK
jgi:hypothetical protein